MKKQTFVLWSASRTADFNQGFAVTGRTFRLDLDVTAASGTTPTLDITVEKLDAAGDWVTHTTFTQATGVTSQRYEPADLNDIILDMVFRLKVEIGGTDPDFTFSVKMTEY